MKKISCKRILIPVVFAIFIAVINSFADSTTSVQASVRDDIFLAKTADQFNAAYYNSSNNIDKIAAISALPMAIKKYNISSQTAIPSWLSAILSDALNNTDLKVVQCAVEQIGNIGLKSYAGTLISMYGKTSSDPQNSKTIVLRMKIIKAIGNLGTSAVGSISFLQKIVDEHQVCPETDAAILAIGQLCLTDLVPNLHLYISDISNKINNEKFIMNDPKKKPLVAPEGSINLALSTIQSLSNGSCGE